MEEKALRRLAQTVVLTELAKKGDYFVPVASSNRHIHLGRYDLYRLFGTGYELTKLRDLIQPGQYACNEYVTLETPAGDLLLRVVGPIRNETQIELSAMDAYKLGIKPVIRVSGDIEGTPGGILKNGERRLEIEKGIIVSARHLHLSKKQSECYGLKDGDIVSLHTVGPRETIYNNVVVRAGEGHELEAHIDKDEANAAALQNGALCRIEKKEMPAGTSMGTLPEIKAERRLIMEEDVKAAFKAGRNVLLYRKHDLITPLAWDAAFQYKIELRST